MTAPTLPEIAATLDHLAQACVKLCRRIPDSAQVRTEVVELLSIAEIAAGMSAAITPQSAPGTGDALHVPGSPPHP